MSRTIRRKSDQGWNQRREALRDYDEWPNTFHTRKYHSPHSEEGKRLLARYHSDALNTVNKEPGPAWYRHVVVDIPWRYEARRQLRMFLKDPEFVVVLNGKDPLPWWD